MMIQRLLVPCLGGMLLAATSVLAQAKPESKPAFPTPSPYPVSWQFDFTHSKPERLVVEVPGEPVPRAFWYMAYTVTNNTSQERPFLPAFDLLAEDGRLIRSNAGLHPSVFQAIQRRTGLKFLEPQAAITGRLLLGPDQARDGVAIWPEPTPEMGKFSIFIGGLSGESAVLIKQGNDLVPVKEVGALNPDQRKELIVLRKALQLNYYIRGDEVYPGEDFVDNAPGDRERWVMR